MLRPMQRKRDHVAHREPMPQMQGHREHAGAAEGEACSADAYRLRTAEPFAESIWLRKGVMPGDKIFVLWVATALMGCLFGGINATAAGFVLLAHAERHKYLPYGIPVYRS